MGARRGGSAGSGAGAHRFDLSQSDEGSSRRIAVIVPIEPGMSDRLVLLYRLAVSGTTRSGACWWYRPGNLTNSPDRLIDQGMPATFQAWIVGTTRELGT